MNGESVRRHDQKCNDKYQSEDNPDEIEILVVHQAYDDIRIATHSFLNWWGEMI